MVRRGVCGSVLLALYCRAVDNGPPWCVWFGSASSLLPCGWYWSAVASIVRLRFLLAFYRRAVVIGPPWRVSFVPAVLLALYCPAVDIALRWYRSAVASVVRLLACVGIVPPCRPFLLALLFL